MTLRDLDDRWLPRAAVRAREWVEALGRWRDEQADRVRGVDLARLDERWTRGPVRGLQRHPVVGLVVALVVAAAGVGVVLDREPGEHRVAVQDQPGGPPSYGVLQGATLGPAIGTDSQTYVRTATEGLLTAARSTPDQARVALVSLATYVTPEGAALLLKGYAVSLVYLRAPAAGHDATPFPVQVNGDVLTALRVAYVDTARSRATAARSYQSYVDALKGSSAEDRTFRSLYQAFARAAGVEAREYASNCACAYAAVVTATPRQLLALRARPGVRVLEVGPVGFTAGQVQVQPLLPEVTGTVPRPTVGGRS